MRHIVPMTQTGLDKKIILLTQLPAAHLSKLNSAFERSGGFTQGFRFHKALLNDRLDISGICLKGP